MNLSLLSSRFQIKTEADFGQEHIHILTDKSSQLTKLLISRDSNRASENPILNFEFQFNKTELPDLFRYLKRMNSSDFEELRVNPILFNRNDVFSQLGIKEWIKVDDHYVSEIGDHLLHVSYHNEQDNLLDNTCSAFISYKGKQLSDATRLHAHEMSDLLVIKMSQHGLRPKSNFTPSIKDKLTYTIKKRFNI